MLCDTRRMPPSSAPAIAAAPAPAGLGRVLLDRGEQVVFATLWALLAWRIALSDNPFGPLVVLSEGAIAFFLIIRRPARGLSLRPADWVVATMATVAPLMVAPSAAPLPGMAWPGTLLVTAGMSFQIWAKFVLRRSFGIAPANRGIKVHGPYRLLRHPMYAGYLVTHVGVLLLMPSSWNVTVYAVAWAAQLLRLRAEERLLGADPAYADYAAHVRWRLVPGLY